MARGGHHLRHVSHCSLCISLRVCRAGPQAGPQTGGENGSSGRLADRTPADANKAAAAARDADLRPILEAMRDRTYRGIAETLTDRGIKTPRG